MKCCNKIIFTILIVDFQCDAVSPPPVPVEVSPTLHAKAAWTKIADFALSKPRIWEEHQLEKIPAQRIIHHTYEHTTGYLLIAFAYSCTYLSFETNLESFV
jgi:hypothetical protein